MMQPTDKNAWLAPTVIRLTDYGALPDSGEDAAVPMQLALDAASRIEGSVVLDCAKGRYDFYPANATRLPYYISNTASEVENADVTKTIGLFFKGMNNVVLEGNGSLFIFHGKQTMIVLDNCDNIEIRNLSTDFARPTMAEMTVEAIGGDYLDARVHPSSRYEIEDGKLYWFGDGWRFREGPMQEFDPVTNRTWRIDNFLEKALKVEQLEPHRLRIHPGSAPAQVAGRVLQMRDGIRDQVGTFVTRSRNIKWSHVGMHYMHGLGIICQYSENLSFDGMDLSPRPETGRTAAAFADFIHVSGCRGKVTISNSRFIGGHDDPINVHGTHLLLVGNPSPNQLLVRFMHHQTYGFEAFFPGDEIEFVRGSSLAAYDSNVVKSAEFITPRDILLTLERPVLSEIREGDVVENVTWTPEVEISDNYFARIPTRGILATTRRKVVIERNVFERMMMSAVSIADDAESWYESGRVSDVTIRGNLFIECGNVRHPVIYVAPENTDVRADEPVHRNILIENNSFNMKAATVLHAKSTRSIIFRDNEIIVESSARKVPETSWDLIHLTACSEVDISDNTIGEGINRNVRLRGTALDTVRVSPKQEFMIMEEK